MMSAHYDIIVMNLSVPYVDSLNYLKRFKAMFPESPIITICRDKAQMFEAVTIGADVDIVQPYDTQELELRLSRLIQNKRPPMKGKLYSKNLTCDQDTRAVYLRGRELQLTEQQKILLEMLMRSPNKPLSRETFLNEICAKGFNSTGNAITVQMHLLRRKLKLDLIKTVGGVDINFVTSKCFFISLLCGGLLSA